MYSSRIYFYVDIFYFLQPHLRHGPSNKKYKKIWINADSQTKVWEILKILKILNWNNDISNLSCTDNNIGSERLIEFSMIKYYKNLKNLMIKK